jgi:hypothetical protein
LPSLYVVNTGSIAAFYQIAVRRLPGQKGLVVPPSWVRIAPTRVRLAPGHSMMIGLKLSVPRRVVPGQYRSGLVATAFLSHAGKNVATGAAAATYLQFTVSGRTRETGSSVPLTPVLLAVIPVVVAAGAFWVWHSRGYSIRIVRRRHGKG